MFSKCIYFKGVLPMNLNQAVSSKEWCVYCVTKSIIFLKVVFFILNSRNSRLFNKS